FYHACMDEAAINAAGVTPIAELAGKIEKAKDLGDILERVGSMHRSVTAGGGGLFRVYVDADDKNPDVYIAKATQGGTGLPDRDFYLEDSEKMRSIRAQYEAHIARMLGFLGDAEADAKQRATAILAFETELARLARPRAEMRDPEKTYNKVGVTGFVALGEGLPWDRYFGGLGYGPDKIGEHL
ncbi:MAG: M13 family peptidase, partial [Myxococcales bacterium]|nr:M13 family peptidase [Myxococcales bacterium]